MSENKPVCRILVIDDNIDAASNLSILLAFEGYEVYSQHDGLSGIRAAEELRPVIIICDISMPGMDGYETARQIRQMPWGQTIRLIALTGYGWEADKRRAKEAGFDTHLLKPVDIETVLKCLQAN